MSSDVKKLLEEEDFHGFASFSLILSSDDFFQRVMHLSLLRKATDGCVNQFSEYSLNMIS
jgi:hypothetical protein